MKTYLVCFDIEDDGIRRRLGRILLEYGERVQRSVFEVALRSDAEYLRLRQRLEQAAGDETDIRFYCLCAKCRENSNTLTEGQVMRFPSALII